MIKGDTIESAREKTMMELVVVDKEDSNDEKNRED